jgi:hypothetical protein
VLPQLSKIRIAGKPFEISIPQSQGFSQSNCCGIEIAIQRITAGQIVKDERVSWLKPGQLFVDFQAVIVPATLGVMVAKDLKRLDIPGVPANKAFHEAYLHVQLADLLPSQPLALVTALIRHTTSEILSN